MKKWSLLVGLGLLVACGTYQFQPTVDVGIAVGDASATVTVTKAVTEATSTTPAKTTWTPGPAGATTFVFQARPGSQAMNITGFKVTSDVIDGKEGLSTPVTTLKTNIYVPSGHSCDLTSQYGNTQSCAFTDPSAVPANGQPTTPLSLDFTSSLVDLVIAKNGSVGRNTTIVFFGRTASGTNVELPSRIASASGIKAGDQ